MTDHDDYGSDDFGQDDYVEAEAASVPDELDEALEQGTMSDVELVLAEVIRHVTTARAMPMSASAMINRDEVLDALEEARERLPVELKEARWLLKEREDFMRRTGLEGNDILEAARAQAEQMVQRTEIVKAAEHRARRIVEAAEDEARRLRLESEDFCDQRLAQFEIVLERTMKMVVAGREKLAAPLLHTASQPVATVEDEAGNAFFDQDQS